MDLLDNSLLNELKENCRVSYSNLAKKFEISKDLIGTRISRLVAQHFILKFTVVPSPSLFGYDKAVLCFRSREPLDEDRITLLGINPNVEFISVGKPLSEGFALIYYRTLDEIKEIETYFQQFHREFEEIRTFPILDLSSEDAKDLVKDLLLSYQKIDWLLLSHLREQGRLSLTELSRRTDIDINTIVERLEFLRSNRLIVETIHINPGTRPKQLWAVFRLELSLFTRPLYNELKRELSAQFGASFWSCWKIIDQPALLLSFFCENFQEFEKTQTWLSDIPGLKSIEYFLGGSTYYFPDFRDELIEEKRSHGWFSPEQWVNR
jgi:DNA-binding Lrp family transcriptional regulator